MHSQLPLEKPKDRFIYTPGRTLITASGLDLESPSKTIKKHRDFHQVDYFLRFGEFESSKIGDYYFYLEA